MTYYFNNPYSDPYFNMAVEEFLFHHYDEPVFHLWQNDKCVVVGKNQLLEAETDKDYLEENEIKTVRRFSGGGAVYQDSGNINLSFMNSSGNINFDSYNEQIVEFLRSLKLNVSSNERRAIFVDDLKISGSAQHIRGNKAIYHVTLLFDANLTHLDKSLKGDESLLNSSKYVRSVRSPVTNLKRYLPDGYELQSFKKDILHFFTNKHSKEIELSADNLTWIDHIKASKYQDANWTRDGRYKYL